MNEDPGSLSNLRDIVVPEAVSWWPLATGWYVVLFLVLATVFLLWVRARRRYKANAYRRAALQLLGRSTTSAEIANILKRTALTVAPRESVASLSGDAWCDWLEKTGPEKISEEVRAALLNSIYGASGSCDRAALRDFAVIWVSRHRVEEGKIMSDLEESRPC